MSVEVARRLVSAILLRACRDAQTDDPLLAYEARRWLTSEGVILAKELGLPAAKVLSWVEALPALAQLPLPLCGSS